VASFVGKLRIAALLGLLIPGLLMPRGETLRVCLHDWFGFVDACSEMATAAEASCCEPEPVDLALSGGHECQGCCFEISNGAGETPALASAVQGALAGLPAPERLPAAMAWPAVRIPVPHRGTRLVAPPGRAPSPLRI
jgi:hypothetical protein